MYYNLFFKKSNRGRIRTFNRQIQILLHYQLCYSVMEPEIGFEPMSPGGSGLQNRRNRPLCDSGKNGAQSGTRTRTIVLIKGF